MSIFPILFNTEMVRAILYGQKTVTRRVVKPQPDGRPVPMTKDSCWPGYFAIQGTEKVVRLPHQPGDILWVRETWSRVETGQYLYRADNENPLSFLGWRPSIHMPKEAARIFLRVTSVRVERLQEITPQQIDAEGCCEYAYNAKTGRLAPSGPSWFKIMWDKTVKPADWSVYGWDANPWVWVIEFERCKRPENWK